MGEFIHRRDSFLPFQTWNAFPPEAIVQVKNADGESRIGPASSFWWGYETEFGQVGDGVIMAARRLDRPIGQTVLLHIEQESRNGQTRRI